MLSLTKKTEYGLIALCHLARQGNVLNSAREIAERQGVPLPLLMNVLKQLHQAGILQSMRGAAGGYALARDPKDVTLDQVIEAIEGPVRLIQCVDRSSPHDDGKLNGTAAHEPVCDLENCCLIRGPLQKLHEQLMRFLEQVTLAEMAGTESVTELTAAGVRVGGSALSDGAG